MICREELDNPNEDGRYSVTGGRNDPNPAWCDCRQGECQRGSYAWRYDLIDGIFEEDDRV